MICSIYGSFIYVFVFIKTFGGQLCVLVSSAHKTTRRDMTYTVLKTTLNPK